MFNIRLQISYQNVWHRNGIDCTRAKRTPIDYLDKKDVAVVVTQECKKELRKVLIELASSPSKRNKLAREARKFAMQNLNIFEKRELLRSIISKEVEIHKRGTRTSERNVCMEVEEICNDSSLMVKMTSQKRQQEFKKANKLMRDQEYQKASKSYEMLIRNCPEQEKVLKNMYKFNLQLCKAKMLTQSHLNETINVQTEKNKGVKGNH